MFELVLYFCANVISQISINVLINTFKKPQIRLH